VIGCHVANNRANFLLSKLIDNIVYNNIDFGIVSNSKISEIHYDKSKFFLFDSENDKFEETNSSNFWFENEKFKIESPFLYYGSLENYSFGASSLFIDSVILAKKYGYKYLHWIEYDYELNMVEILDNVRILKGDEYGVVLYETESEGHPISGSFISVNIDKINISKFYTNKEDRKKILNEYGNSSEKFIKKYLFNSENTYTKSVNTISTINGFSQVSRINMELVVFEENNEIKLFLKNNTKENIEYLTSTNINKVKKNLKPLHWTLDTVGNISQLDHFYFKSEIKNLYINLKDDNEVKKYIKRNIIYRK
jgi:hypothetical protein